MFGIGNLFGSMAGGFLDKLGLGKITPFVKMGLNAITGNWMGVAKDVFGLVSNFKGDFLNKASSQPPLGNFQQPSEGKTPLSKDRMNGLMDILKQLLQVGGQNPGLDKLNGLFGAVKSIFDNFSQFGDQSTKSMFANMKV